PGSGPDRTTLTERGELMSDVATTVDTYLAMWNEPDPDRRAGHIERAWAADAHYVDPLLEAEGHAALSEMVAGVHGQFPGHRFRRARVIDPHHRPARVGRRQPRSVRLRVTAGTPTWGTSHAHAMAWHELVMR